jgi:iron complex outermembrane receptor protein
MSAKKSLRCSISVAAIFAAGGAFAQESSGGFDEVVVTAQRRAENIQDAPLSVTAISDENLRDRSVNSVQEIAKFLPNVEINEGRADAAGSQAAIFIRGVGQTDFLFPNDPGVGLYLDGVYLARSVGTNLELADIERIEVLRGPQGTLYGKNTIGGAINVVTKTPNMAEFEGELRLTAGNYDRIDVNGYVSGPIIKDLLAFKISGITRNQDGFSIRNFDGLDLGNINRDGLRGALLFTPGEKLRVTLNADWSRQRENGSATFLANVIPSENLVGAPVPDLTPSTPLDLIDLFNFVAAPATNAALGLDPTARFDGRWITGSRFSDNGTSPSFNNHDILGGSVTIDYTLSDKASIKSITAYREIEAEFGRDGDNSPYTIVQTANNQEQHQWSQELQLSLELFDGRLNWITGGFFLDEQATDLNRVLLINPLTQFTGGLVNTDWLPGQKIDVRTWAIFSQGTFALTDAFNITLGGRWSYDRKELAQFHTTELFPIVDGFGNTTFCYTCEADGITPRTLDQSFDEFTPRVALDYSLPGGHLVYASYSKGFKSGGWSPRPTPTNPSDLPFGPETIDAFELGYKSDYFDRRLLVSLAGFYNIYRDVQLTTLQPNFLLQVTNAAKSRIIGAELEAAARPIEGLDLNFAASFLDNKYTELDTADIQLTEDDVLPDAPKWILSMGAQYRFPVGRLFDVTLRGDANYRSKNYRDPFNLRRDSLLQFVGATPTFLPIPDGVDGYRVDFDELATDPYWIANARLTINDPSDRWELAFFATNLFDEAYATTILPVTAFGYDGGTWGRPREWGASLAYRF